ncbi:unnamed protein product [Amoebophrya sp. A25]|nr:unnamed protein product [Amoebophrya sp. A25]|eukprot:GSA25T00010454001.1
MRELAKARANAVRESRKILHDSLDLRKKFREQESGWDQERARLAAEKDKVEQERNQEIALLRSELSKLQEEVVSVRTEGERKLQELQLQTGEVIRRMQQDSQDEAAKSEEEYSYRLAHEVKKCQELLGKELLKAGDEHAGALQEQLSLSQQETIRYQDEIAELRAQNAELLADNVRLEGLEAHRAEMTKKVVRDLSQEVQAVAESTMQLLQGREGKLAETLIDAPLPGVGASFASSLSPSGDPTSTGTAGGANSIAAVKMKLQAMEDGLSALVVNSAETPASNVYPADNDLHRNVNEDEDFPPNKSSSRKSSLSKSRSSTGRSRGNKSGSRSGRSSREQSLRENSEQEAVSVLEKHLETEVARRHEIASEMASVKDREAKLKKEKAAAETLAQQQEEEITALRAELAGIVQQERVKRKDEVQQIRAELFQVKNELLGLRVTPAS